jgi:hypothetical protein
MSSSSGLTAARTLSCGLGHALAPAAAFHRSRTHLGRSRLGDGSIGLARVATGARLVDAACHVTFEEALATCQINWQWTADAAAAA